MDPVLVEALAKAIIRVECCEPGSKPYPLNNPGMLWDGWSPGKTKRIWPHIPIDQRGFLIFSSEKHGMDTLRGDIRYKIAAGLTLREFIQKYAPRKHGLTQSNNTELYIKKVSQSLGIHPDVRLQTAQVRR